MDEDFLQILKGRVLEFLCNEEVEIVLFGSRSRGDASSASDVDIGIIPKNGFDRRKLTLLRESIENMNIPFKVDIVDFTHVSEEFKKEVLKDAVRWKD